MVDKVYQGQAMVKKAALDVQHCLYVVGQALTKGASKRIVYIVITVTPKGVMQQFTCLLVKNFGHLFLSFFMISNI